MGSLSRKEEIHDNEMSREVEIDYLRARQARTVAGNYIQLHGFILNHVLCSIRVKRIMYNSHDLVICKLQQQPQNLTYYML